MSKVKLSDLHTAEASTHYHITGSLTYSKDPHKVILHALKSASFTVKRCDAKDIGDHLMGRCDYEDYDPEKMHNLRLTLLTEPVANDFTQGVLIDMDYIEILPCTVMPTYCIEIQQQGC